MIRTGGNVPMHATAFGSLSTTGNTASMGGTYRLAMTEGLRDGLRFRTVGDAGPYKVGLSVLR